MNKKWISILLIFICSLFAVISYYNWDIELTIYCKTLSRSILDIAEIITIAGESRWYYFILVFGFLIFYYFKKNQLWSSRFLFIFASLSTSGLVNMLVKWIAGRNRPINYFTKGLFGFDYFHSVYEMTSFPSGHTVTAFSLAAAISVLFPRWSILAFIVAFAIGASRVVITSHYLSDVIAGAGIGILSTIAVKYFFDRKNIEIIKK